MDDRMSQNRYTIVQEDLERAAVHQDAELHRPVFVDRIFHHILSPGTLLWLRLSTHLKLLWQRLGTHLKLLFRGVIP